MKPRWEFVTDEMQEGLETLIHDEFYGWQKDLGIEDGGLPSELEYQLDNAIDYLYTAFNECVAWQAEMAQETE